MAVRLARRFGELTETLQLVDWIGSLEVEGGGYGVKAGIFGTPAPVWTFFRLSDVSARLATRATLSIGGKFRHSGLRSPPI